MSLINVSNLTFSYEGSYDNIFENVSFRIDTDWKIGFVGRNGRGKTTFLNLLFGKYEYSGTISSDEEFAYFPYTVDNADEYTIDVVSGLCPSCEQWQIMRELNLLSVSDDTLYREFKSLSNGEQTKVLLAALFLRENKFLLIDEPTNHLDINARKAVGDYLKTKKGFILVSHDRDLLDTCVDHILSINKSNIVIEKGNFSSWYVNKERQDNFELAENQKLKHEIKRLEKTALEKTKWSDSAESKKIGFDPTKTEKSISRRPYQGAKSKKMMKRAKQIEERRERSVEEKSKLLKNIETAESLKLSPLEFRRERLVTADKLSIYYGQRQVCDNISFQINNGDRIALKGKNGCGKSSILKLICGEEIEYSGLLKKESGLIISYVPQNTMFLKGNLKSYARDNNLDESLLKAILRKLDFDRVQFEKDMSQFSAGQRKKVLIAKSLCEKAHLYIWDEPLNYIDVFSRIQIEELLLKFRPTLLFVEHDKSFCEKIATDYVEL